jgi:hypothetical protein
VITRLYIQPLQQHIRILPALGVTDFIEACLAGDLGWFGGASHQLVCARDRLALSAFGASQVSSKIPPLTEPCQLPVSQVRWLIEMDSLEGFWGRADSSDRAMPTNSTAAIAVSRRCFISLISRQILMLH